MQKADANTLTLTKSIFMAHLADAHTDRYRHSHKQVQTLTKIALLADAHTDRFRHSHKQVQTLTYSWQTHTDRYRHSHKNRHSHIPGRGQHRQLRTHTDR